MMKEAVCPKCKSHSIFTSKASPNSSDRVALKEGTFMGRDASRVTRYVCGDCGYLEYYLEEPADLQFIRENWEPVQRS